MKYKNKTFSVAVGNKKYRDNWEAAFGKSKKEKFLEAAAKFNPPTSILATATAIDAVVVEQCRFCGCEWVCPDCGGNSE